MTHLLEVGKNAPDFTLASDGGGSVALAKLKGRKIVLYFYPKDDTSGCTMEAKDFSLLQPEFSKANTEIVGISPDNAQSHDKFKKKYGLCFPLAADVDKTVLEAYGVWVEKSMYGRKYMGVERTTVLIDATGKIARIWNKVKVPGHAQEVLSASREI